MLRFLAGAAACLLLVTGALLIWQSRAERAPGLPAAPAARSASLFAASTPLEAPEASAKNREEKRFSRADKDKDGKVEAEELLGRAARRSPSSTPTAMARCRSTNGRSRRSTSSRAPTRTARAG